MTLCVIPTLVSAKTILILGDSLSAGYGIDAKQGWVNLLQQRLDQQYPKQHKVVNASVSGEPPVVHWQDCQNCYRPTNPKL